MRKKQLALRNLPALSKENQNTIKWENKIKEEADD